MRRNLKSYATIGLAFLSLSVTGCLDKEQSGPPATEPEKKEYNRK